MAYGDYYDNSGKATVMALMSNRTTTTTVSSSVNPSISGQSVTFTATVAPAAATGTVDFMDGATPLASVLLAGGVATFSTSGLAAGDHSITAVYSGDNSYDGSTSAPLTQTVNFPIMFPLTTTITGIGRVTSGTGIDCSGPSQSGTCSATYPTGTVVTLTAAVNNSVFSGWGNACVSCGSALSCLVTVNAPKTCSAAFVDPAAPIFISGTSQTFSLFQPAYDAAGNGAVIKAREGTFIGSLLLDVAGRSVTIKGGYGPACASQSESSTIQGKVTIGKGGVVADRLAIR